MNKKVIIGGALVLLVGTVSMLAAARAGWLDGLRSDETQLRSRIEAYWNARVAGDVSSMAQFAHPLQQGSPNPDMLITDGYEIETMEIKGDTAQARIRVRSHINHPRLASRSRESVLNSRWVKHESNWYRAIGAANLTEALRGIQQGLHPEAAPSNTAAEAPGQSDDTNKEVKRNDTQLDSTNTTEG